METVSKMARKSVRFVPWHKLAVAAAALVGTSSAAVATQNCKPVVGSFQAFLVQPGQGNCPPVPNALCTAGRVWGGLQASYQFVASGFVPSASIGGVATVQFFAGRSTIALKSGDQLFGTDTGSLDLPPGKGGFASLITFTGGTGAMTGATGQIKLRGDLDPVEGSTSGDYLGTVCTQ